MWVAQPFLDSPLLVVDDLGHAGRIDAHKSDAVTVFKLLLREEADGGAVCRDKTAPFEGVTDNGEMGRPVGVIGAAPELDEGKEDVLIRVEGTFFKFDAWVEGNEREEVMVVRCSCAAAAAGGGGGGKKAPVRIGSGEVGVAAGLGQGYTWNGWASGSGLALLE